MEREEWRPFLKRWSEEWISSHDPEHDHALDADVAREGWLGFAPAPAKAIARLAERLGLPLPPSLRGFLEVTDGWRDAGMFIYRLGGTAEIGFMRDMDASWIAAYGHDHGDAEYAAATGALLRRAVQISLDGDASVLFLDPDDIDDHGEWAAYELASWSGEGPQRKSSFYDLMYDLYASFHALRRPEGETRRTWDARVEEARLAALGGEIDGPLTVLTEAERFGDTRATLLADQLRTLLQNAGGRRLIHAFEDGWIHEDPVFASDLLPLMFAQHERAYPGTSDLAFLMRQGGSGSLRLMITDYRARVREPGFRIRFGNDEFDRAVHAVLDRLSAVPAFGVPKSEERRHRPGEFVVGTAPETLDAERGEARRALDEAWPAIRDAVRLWRPAGDHHIAPVVLLADPLLAQMIDQERGREILAVPRGGR
ncbi:SMI1/KNR4 family protein [Actinomadura formosensis]|uniref:SMI1/KNR4 family protein n=1 Tax=Actinomadura formosensis TaxID=60706 RepID=UPI00083485FA|nr:SMI1/KNR4 family protein [Actinomadura formosensis]